MTICHPFRGTLCTSLFSFDRQRSLREQTTIPPSEELPRCAAPDERRIRISKRSVELRDSRRHRRWHGQQKREVQIFEPPANPTPRLVPLRARCPASSHVRPKHQWASHKTEFEPCEK